MGLFRKKKRIPTFTREQALACTPVRNNVVSWKRVDSVGIQVEYVLMLKPFFASILERFNPAPSEAPTRKLQLDDFGSQVWEMLDGSRTTADLIKEFAAGHEISAQEAEQSITLFLRELGKRGLIALR